MGIDQCRITGDGQPSNNLDREVCEHFDVLVWIDRYVRTSDGYSLWLYHFTSHNVPGRAVLAAADRLWRVVTALQASHDAPVWSGPSLSPLHAWLRVSHMPGTEIIGTMVIIMNYRLLCTRQKGRSKSHAWNIADSKHVRKSMLKYCLLQHQITFAFLYWRQYRWALRWFFWWNMSQMQAQ